MKFVQYLDINGTPVLVANEMEKMADRIMILAGCLSYCASRNDAKGVEVYSTAISRLSSAIMKGE